MNNVFNQKQWNVYLIFVCILCKVQIHSFLNVPEIPTFLFTSSLQTSLGYPFTAYSLYSPPLSRLALLVSFLAQSDVFIAALKHASCLTTDAMFIHGRKRTASPAYPLQTSPWLPFWLSLQLLPHIGCSVSCLPARQIYICCGLCDRGAGKH